MENNMKPILELPPQEELLKLFRYDSSTGLLYWTGYSMSTRKFKKNLIDKPAGTMTGKEKYLRTRINGKKYLNHRIIYKMFHGEEPSIVDHIDTNSANNRIENLRAASSSQNAHNTSHSRGKCNKRGITVKGDKYIARIQINGKRQWLGIFTTEEAAYEAYRAAASVLGTFTKA